MFIKKIKNVNITRFINKEIGRLSEGATEHSFNVPWRDDKKASGSFNSEKQIWYDHGTGESGDIIDFIARKYGYSRDAARKYLKRENRRKIIIKKHRVLERKHVKKYSDVSDYWDVVEPVPTEAEDYPIPQDAYKYLSKVGEYQYRDIYGKLKGVVCRWENKAGDKTIRPFTFCRNRKTGEKAWRMKDFPKPYPIYGIENFHRTKCPILIVEGEKCVEEARKIVGDVFLVVTWHGGAKRVKDTDWSPLQDESRHKIIFPDNDLEGRKAMVEIVRMIENGRNQNS